MLSLRAVVPALALLSAACGTTGIRVPVLVPAPVNLVQYERVAVDRFEGDGCAPFSEQLAEALRQAHNPMTDQVAFEVLHRKDVDEALDRIRDRRGDDWDERTMQVLDHWRTAQVAIAGTMLQHRVVEDLLQQETVDRQGRPVVVRTRRATAEVQVALEVTDLDGDTVFDRVTLRGAATAEQRATDGAPAAIDGEAVLARARSQVVGEYLTRVLPHQVWVQVALYSDSDLPDLQIGNGYAETGNWPQAVESYRRAVAAASGELAAARHKALHNLGVAYEFSDRFDEARSALQEAYALGREDMSLQELRRVDHREQQVARLREQGAAAARPAR